MSNSRTIPILPRQAPAAEGYRPQLASPPPLSLYVHFPWCVRKCPYCDFNSHAVRDAGIPEEAYLDALSR
ncbi:oxygen-independent coproporphyrinogen III oxidase-like protein, partial [Uliginosibacterium sp. sgz301328]